MKTEAKKMPFRRFDSAKVLFCLVLSCSCLLPSVRAQLVNYQWQSVFYAKIDDSKEPMLAFFRGARFSKMALADLDNDGDADMLIGDETGLISFFDNRGTAKAPRFVLVSQNVNAKYEEETEDEFGEAVSIVRFGNIDVGSYSAPLLTDYDADGDYDLFVGNGEGKLFFFRNIGNTSAFRFSLETKDYLGRDLGTRLVPALIDANMDREPDLLIGNGEGEIHLGVNSGNLNLSNRFSPIRRIARIENGFNASPAVVDWDRDGDMDIVAGQRSGYLVYFENNGSVSRPEWDPTNDYFQGIDAGGESAPFFIDLNGDRLPDALIGNINNYIPYYENRTFLDERTFWSIDDNVTRVWRMAIGGKRPMISSADFNGDGHGDFLIGRDSGKLLLYANLGFEEDVLNLRLVTDDLFPEAKARNASPDFGDLNGDGLVDIVVGNSKGNVGYFRNTGTREQPSWTLDSPTLGDIFVKGNGSPRLIDVDGDKDLDLYMGGEKGELRFFRNLGTVREPVFVQERFTHEVEELKIEEETTLSLADWNQLGRLDLKIGTRDGKIYSVSRFIGEKSVKVTLANGDEVQLQMPALKDLDWELNEKLGFVGPYFTDFDGDGKIDFMMGAENGAVMVYRQLSSKRISDDEIRALGALYADRAQRKINSRKSLGDIVADPVFVPTSEKILDAVDFIRPVPTFGDLDGDGDMDMAVGNHAGELRIYENVGVAERWDFGKEPERVQLAGKQYNISPVLIDYDGDGDLDLLTGNEAGRIYYYENVGTPSAYRFVLKFEHFRSFNAGANAVPTVFYEKEDGAPKLLVGNIRGNLVLIDTSRTSDPSTASVVVDANYLNIDIGLTSAPKFYDLNNDKISEILLGSDSGRLLVLQRNEANQSPPWKERKDYLPEFEFESAVFPAIVDLDGDGDVDMVVGEDDGKLIFFRNDAFKRLPKRKNDEETQETEEAETADEDLTFNDAGNG